MAGFSRETFDFAGYAKLQNLPDSIDITQPEVQDELYRHAVTSVRDEFDREKGVKTPDAIRKTLEQFPDGYEILGHGKPRSVEEEAQALGVGAFKEFIAAEVKNNPFLAEQPVKDLVPLYTSTFKDKYIEFPNLSRRGIKTQLNKALEANLQGANVYGSARDFVTAEESLPETVSKTTATDEGADYFGALVSGFKRLGALPEQVTANRVAEESSIIASGIEALDKLPAGDIEDSVENAKNIGALVEALPGHSNAFIGGPLLSGSVFIRKYNETPPEDRGAMLLELRDQAAKRKVRLDNTLQRNLSEANRVDTEAQKSTPKDLNLSQTIMRGVLENTPTTLVSLGLAALTRGRGVAFSAAASKVPLSVMAGEQETAGALAKGLDFSTARGIGGAKAVSELATEAIPGFFVAKLIKKGGADSFVKDAISAIVADGGGEAANSLIGEYIDHSAKVSSVLDNPDLTPEQRRSALAEQSLTAGLIGLFSSTAASAGIKLSQKTHEKIYGEGTKPIEREALTVSDIMAGTESVPDTAKAAAYVLSSRIVKADSDAVTRNALNLTDAVEAQKTITDTFTNEELSTLAKHLPAEGITAQDTLAFDTAVAKAFEEKGLVTYDEKLQVYVPTENNINAKTASAIVNSSTARDVSAVPTPVAEAPVAEAPVAEAPTVKTSAIGDHAEIPNSRTSTGRVSVKGLRDAGFKILSGKSNSQTIKVAKNNTTFTITNKKGRTPTVRQDGENNPSIRANKAGLVFPIPADTPLVVAPPANDALTLTPEGAIDVEVLRSDPEISNVDDSGKGVKFESGGIQYTVYQGTKNPEKFTVNAKSLDGVALSPDRQTNTLAPAFIRGSQTVQPATAVDGARVLKNAERFSIELESSIRSGEAVRNQTQDEVLKDRISALVLNEQRVEQGVTEDIGGFVVEDGKAVLPPDVDDTLSVEVPESGADDVAFLLYNMRTQSTSDIQLDVFDDDTIVASPTGTTDWTQTDLDFYRNLLPAHIAERVEFLSEPGNYVQQKGDAVNGLFSPTFDRRGPRILIDTDRSRGRTLEQIVATLSHEVSHFSWNSFNPTPIKGRNPIQKAYDLAWSMYKGDIAETRATYIERYNVDMNNPADAHVQLLLDEYFAEQGMGLMELTNGRIKPPAGLEHADLVKLKEAVQGATTAFVQDITNKAEIGDKGAAASFARTILSMQHGALYGRSVSIEYVDGSDTITLHPTRYGSMITRNSIDDKDIQRAQRDVDRNYNRKWNQDKMWEVLAALNPVSKRYDTEIAHLISSSGGSATKRLADALRAPLGVMRSAKGMLAKAGVDVANMPDPSYVTTFKTLGLTSKRQLKVAREADAHMESLTKLNHRHRSNIIAAGRETIATLRALGKEQGIAPEVIAQFVEDTQAQVKRLTNEDWSHRRYEAHQSHDRENLITMRDSLVNPKRRQELEDAVAEAKKKEAEYDNRIKSGEVLSSRDNLKRIDLQNTIRLQTRLDALENAIRFGYFRDKFSVLELREGTINIPTTPAVEKYISELGADAEHFKVGEITKDAPAEIVGDLTAFLDSFENEKSQNVSASTQQKLTAAEVRKAMIEKLSTMASSSTVGSASASKIDLTSAARKRRIDDNTSAGKEWITFLGEIKDPLEVLVHSVEQRGLIASNMRSANRVAERLTGLRLGVLKTSGLEDITGDDNIGKFQSGSVLKYLSVDPNVAEFLDQELELAKSIKNTAWTRSISQVKKTFTTYNPGTMVINYTGNVDLMLLNGHLFDAANMRQFVKTVPQMFNNTYYLNAQDGKQGSPEEVIYAEMEAEGLLLNSESRADVQYKGLVGQASKLMSGSVKLSGAITSSTKEVWDANVDNFIQSVENLYAQGDDVPKLLSYIANRRVYLLKHEATIPREGFPTDHAWRLEVLKRAVQDAGRRTRLENTDYSALPDAFRKLMRQGGVQVIVPNFVTHNIMMGKVYAAQGKLWREDINALRASRDLTSDAGVAYHKMLKKRIAQRVAGTLVSGAHNVAVVSGAGSLVYWAGQSVLQAFHTDDEDREEAGKPFDKRTYYTNSTEFKAASQALYYSTNFNGNVMSALPYRDDGYIYGYGSKQNSAPMAIVPNIDPEAPLAIEDIGKSLVGLLTNYEQDGLAVQIADVLMNNTTKKGRKLSYTEKVNELANFFIPLKKQGEALFGLNYDGKLVDKEWKQKAAALRFAGQRVTRISIEDLIGDIGENVYRFNNAKYNTPRGILFEASKKPYELSDTELTAIVNNDLDIADKNWSRVRAMVVAQKGLGVSDQTIRRFIQKPDENDPKKKNINDHMAGLVISSVNGNVNGLAEAAFARLERDLGKRRRKPTVRFKTEQGINIDISNASRLLVKYREEMLRRRKAR